MYVLSENQCIHIFRFHKVEMPKFQYLGFKLYSWFCGFSDETKAIFVQYRKLPLIWQIINYKTRCLTNWVFSQQLIHIDYALNYSENLTLLWIQKNYFLCCEFFSLLYHEPIYLSGFRYTPNKKSERLESDIGDHEILHLETKINIHRNLDEN